MTANLMSLIVSPLNMAKAWQWLKTRRGKSHFNHDYWHLRHHRKTLEPEIIRKLQSGTYRFSPCRAYRGLMVWDAQDALVLKAVAFVLSDFLNPMLSADCYSVSGRGGQKGCVRVLSDCVANYRFVCRSDVNSYYATVDHTILMQQLAVFIPCENVLALIARMLDRLDDVAGELFAVDVGITKGNPLSPLLGGVYLHAMDTAMGAYCKRRGLRYFRFMDDWVVLCKTRHELRDVVRIMNTHLAAVNRTKHPPELNKEETFIGRIKETGFDFLGYRLAVKQLKGLGLAWKTYSNHLCKLRQLYEQGVCAADIGEYVKRWLRWVGSGVDFCWCGGFFGWDGGANASWVELQKTITAE